ncbi:MAG: ATP-grasp fold amidoligase family protein [Abditibacteriaceae bacterium]
MPISISMLTQASFSAKVRWRMKYQRNPLFVILQDKYKVREYTHSKGVRTAELLFVTDQPEDIPFAELPPRYMIKANHGCGWNILCYDSRFYLFGDGKKLVNEDGSFLNESNADSCQLSEAAVLEKCKKWLSSKHNEAEWAYQQIPPKIIVEKLLFSRDNQPLYDYRFYTFEGVVKAINMGSPLFRKHTKNIFFDAEWNEFPLTRYMEARPDQIPKMPDCLPEMLGLAKKLGEGIDFVRIDLYDTCDGIVLGEITIYPNGGTPLAPTACPVFNKWLGDQWVLSAADTRKAILFNIGFSLRTFPKNTIRRIRYNLRNSA